MQAVRFRVLAIEGKRSTNSDIQVGGTYAGELKCYQFAELHLVAAELIRLKLEARMK